MNKLIKLLRSPYPILCQRWKTVTISPVIVFLIISLLQPFGISHMNGDYKLFMLMGYGVASLVALCITIYLLPALFPIYYKEQTWTLGKNLFGVLITCLLVTVCNWLYTAWLYDLNLNWRLFVVCIAWVTLLSPFPIVLFMMWNRNLHLACNLREAVEMNFYLSTKASLVDKEKESKMLLLADGTKEMLEMKADDFFYAEAEGNYVKVVFRSVKDGKIVQKLLRATMKQMEEEISVSPFIIRCHRAFFVNARLVTKVDGNSQGYRLRLDGCPEEIPVSRAYAKEVKAMIESVM